MSLREKKLIINIYEKRKTGAKINGQVAVDSRELQNLRNSTRRSGVDSGWSRGDDACAPSRRPRRAFPHKS